MTSHPADSPPQPPLARQRKRLTVLMTDLCGSTRLGGDMEMEQYAEVMDRVRALWHAAVESRGGRVLREQGDGALAVFGLRRAGELDVVKAIDAALEVHGGLVEIGREALAGPASLRARTGIHAGVGLIEEGSPEQGLYNLVGDIANVAGKLEKYAGPGEVFVSREALGPHAGLFVLEPRRVPAALEQQLGSAEGRQPPVLRVVDRTGLQRRFEATSLRGLTPLIGRAPLLASLRSFLDPEREGERCAVVTGDVGLGKTRLLEELAGSPEATRWRVLRGGCESYDETEVLQPFVQMARGLLPATEAGPPDPDEAALLAALRGRESDAVLRHFGSVARRARLLLVIDDWQWADEASRRLLQALLELRDGPRVLLMARPHPEGLQWIPQARQLRIDPWSEEETAQAVGRWLAADPLLIARIHAYTGGVPLFVEEVCHSTSAVGLWREFETRGTPRDAGLRQLVAARLAQLPRELVELVRAAAVIGNDAPRWLLDAVCGRAVAPAQVLALAEADLLYLDREREALQFKHGIARSAILDDIGLGERRQMHRRAREALQVRQPAGDSHERLAALAYHCEGAGEFEQAARHAEQAGHLALKAYAMDLARGHFRRAMAALQRAGPAGPEHEAWACELACSYASACVFDPLALGTDTGVFEEAVRRAEALGDAGLHARTLLWLAYMLYCSGRFREAMVHARAALELSRRSGPGAVASQVEATLGEILIGTCEYEEGVRHIDQAVRDKRLRALEKGRGLPVGAAYALACKGSVFADRGEFDRAQACFHEAIELLGPSMHPVGNSVRNWISVACIWQGDWKAAQRVASESLRIAENTGALYLVAVARSTLGFARWCETGDAEGLRMLEDAVGWMETRGGRLFTSLHFGWLAEASATEGRTGRARVLAGHVLQRARHGERLGQAIACRALALMAAGEGDAARAQRWLARADRAAVARGSPREQALNALARAAVSRRLGMVQPLAAPAASSRPLALPAKSLLAC